MAPLLALGMIQAAEASFPVTIAWDANTEPDLAGYTLYMKPMGGTYLPIWDSVGTETVTVITLSSSGVYYFKLTAHDADANESGFSNEIVVYEDGLKFLHGKIRIEEMPDGLWIEFLEHPDDITKIGLNYGKIDTTEHTLDFDQNVFEDFVDLAPGSWQIQIVLINEAGDRMVDYFEVFTANIGYPLPDTRIGMVYRNGGPHRLLIGVQDPAENMDFAHYTYQVDLFSTYNRAHEPEALGDIASFDANTNNIYYDIPFAYRMVFANVRSVNLDTGQTGTITYAWHLVGNLVGTYNDGIDWRDSYVNMADLAVISGNIFKSISRPTIDQYPSQYLYPLLPFTGIVLGDMNASGRIDMADLTFYSAYNGNRGSLPQYTGD